MAFDFLRGQRSVVMLPLDSTSADIVVGTAITASGATDGYFKEVDATGELVVGIAMSDVSSPSADGAASVKVDVSRHSLYLTDPDAGSVAVTLLMNTADVGADGLTVNIDASVTDDIEIVAVDTSANTLTVRLNQAFPGVA